MVANAAPGHRPLSGVLLCCLPLARVTACSLGSFSTTPSVAAQHAPAAPADEHKNGYVCGCVLRFCSLAVFVCGCGHVQRSSTGANGLGRLGPTTAAASAWLTGRDSHSLVVPRAPGRRRCACFVCKVHRSRVSTSVLVCCVLISVSRQFRRTAEFCARSHDCCAASDDCQVARFVQLPN